ncbi:hypothetical protein TOPH_02010 [Tolypocladium ophioglossoides CBS 100239]|uniref:Uncharacterized protein n=1 Tax=Tolypocladium ophioglossoides (strain CBS 100239) TaxID=1163406 RepID=A0A0L0NFS7_TOLOC|nr:hypothetical protein TOPH_02010 [Tolypocladium ophioglossoides CBS 100239]
MKWEQDGFKRKPLRSMFILLGEGCELGLSSCCWSCGTRRCGSCFGIALLCWLLHIRGLAEADVADHYMIQERDGCLMIHKSSCHLLARAAIEMRRSMPEGQRQCTSTYKYFVHLVTAKSQRQAVDSLGTALTASRAQTRLRMSPETLHV